LFNGDGICSCRQGAFRPGQVILQRLGCERVEPGSWTQFGMNFCVWFPHHKNMPPYKPDFAQIWFAIPYFGALTLIFFVFFHGVMLQHFPPHLQVGICFKNVISRLDMVGPGDFVPFKLCNVSIT